MPPSVNPHRRLNAVNYEFDIELDNGSGKPIGVHKIIVSLAYDAHDVLREVAFAGRGKIGHGVDKMLHELGIKLSRAIQDRDPVNGEAVPKSIVHEPR